MLTLTIYGTTDGQDCCPEGGWGELLRKEGDPIYKDKGVVEKGKRRRKEVNLLNRSLHQHQFYLLSVSRKSDPEDQSSEEEEQTTSVKDGVEREDAAAMGSSDLNIYRVGNGSRCIVWNYDIFGFNGGRTREIADLMASKGVHLPFHDLFCLIGTTALFHDHVTQGSLC